MRTIYIIPFFLLLSNILFAQSNYAVSEINPDLLKNVNAVIRTTETKMEYKTEKKVIQTEKIVITVLNKYADEARRLFLPYDNLSQIKYVRGVIYDEYGFVIKNLAKSDINDISNNYGSVFFSDQRAKSINFPAYSYPYTVEFEYQYKYKFSLISPFQSFINNPNYSIEHSGIQIIVANNLDFEFKNLNTNSPTEVYKDKKNTTYTWQENNIHLEKREPYSPSWKEEQAGILSKINTFAIGNTFGKQQNWGDIARWYSELNQNRDVLPQNTIDRLKQINKIHSDTIDKIKAIYKYLQNNTRYVNIAFGLGGYQTMEALKVDEYGYGDCKALSNYTKAMLKTIGIQSNLVLIKAGKDNKNNYSDFPSNQFNHVILAVPMQKDTIWLECTSQDNPFNYLSSFTEDRNALWINKNNGFIVHTPSLDAANNVSSLESNINIQEDGNAQAKLTLKYSGLKYENLEGLLSESKKSQMDWLYKHFDLQLFEIKDFKLEKKPNASLLLTLDLKLPYFAVKTKKYLYFTPSLSFDDIQAPEYNKNRTKDVVINESATQKTQIIYTIPETYEITLMPQNFNLKTKFGTVNYTYEKTNANHILFSSEITLNEGRFGPEEYTNFRNFLIQIFSFENKRILLKKIAIE